MMLEAQALTPHEALDIGLVNRVVAEAELLGEATATAERLARRAPESVAALKRASTTVPRGRSPSGLAIERKWFLATVSKPRGAARDARLRGPDRGRGRRAVVATGGAAAVA